MSFESVRNYYERLVFNYIDNKFAGQSVDPEYLADIASIALNHLPPRYYRYAVHIAYYISPLEQEEIEKKVAAAVEDAIEHIASRPTD